MLLFLGICGGIHGLWNISRGNLLYQCALNRSLLLFPVGVLSVYAGMNDLLGLYGGTVLCGYEM